MIAKFNLKFEGFRQVFIDQATIRARYESKARKALGRIGAVLRQEARSSIRRRVVTGAMRQRLNAAAKGTSSRAYLQILETIRRRQATVSSPGEPPYAHVPDNPVASIRAIYFAVDESREVTIGPVRANQSVNVPELLEFGGSAQIEEERFGYLGGRPGPWTRRNLRSGTKPWKRYRTRNATWAPRPFMGPTLSRNQQTIRNLLAAAF